MTALEDKRPWHVGATFVGGLAPGYAISGALNYPISFHFLSGGGEAGKVLFEGGGSSWYSGKAEAIVELLPYWFAVLPVRTVPIRSPEGEDFGIIRTNRISWHGIAATPLLGRWNFTHLRRGRMTPYAQVGAGLLWTTHNFPAGTALLNQSTSRINFTPQGGVGANIFTRERQSIDWNVKVIHYSSAGIGNYNPGVNYTLQFGIGYSWWK